MNQTLVDLQFWRGVHWRSTVLMVMLAGMEISWITPLAMTLHPRSWDKSPLLYLLGMWGIMLVMIMVAHFLSTRQVDSPLFELAVLGTILLIGFVLLRLYVFWGEPVGSLRWLAAPFTAGEPRRLEVLLLLAVLAYLWWRGVTFLQRDAGFFVVGYDFRKGVLGLVAGIVFFHAVSGQPGVVFVYPFFFFALMAVALGRIEDKSRVTPGAEQAFSARWLAILALCSLAVVLLVFVFSLIWHTDVFSASGRILAPAGSVLGNFVGGVLVFLFRLLEPLLQWLFLTIREAMLAGGFDPENFIQPPQPLGETLGADASGNLGDSALPAWLSFIINYVLPAVMVIGVLIILVFWLERQRRGRRPAGKTGQQGTVPGDEKAGLSSLLQQGAGRLRDLAAMVGQFGLGRSFYAAISIRHIYGNVQRLASDLGYPRHQAQTPNDYLRDLETAFPNQQDALQQITHAYNAYEYGEVPTEAEELAKLQAAWESVRNAPAPPPSSEQPED